jgi:hypothetical protein
MIGGKDSLPNSRASVHLQHDLRDWPAINTWARHLAVYVEAAHDHEEPREGGV